MSYPNGGYDQNNGGSTPYGNDPYGQSSANQPGHPDSQGSANTYGQYPDSQGSANTYGQYPDSQGSANTYGQYPDSQGSANTYGQPGIDQAGQQGGGGYGQAQDPYGQQDAYGPQGGHGQQGGYGQPDPYGQQQGYQNGGGYPEPSGMVGQPGSPYGGSPYGAGPYGANQRPAVSLPQAIKAGFKNYANFYGRASKSEFWYWILFYVLASIVVGIVGGVLNSVMGFDPSSANLGSGETNPSGILSGVFNLALLLPWVSLGVRRMHDTDRSGWFMALQLIPVVGIIIVLVMGNGEPNPHGARFDNPDGSQPKLP